MAGIVVVLAACGGSTSGEDLDRYLCRQDDVGDDYQELARGDFSPRDLADLGPNADEREREFREAGMERGRFAFFKQSLSKPPFDPPIDVLCQVLEFESDAAAAKFVRDLEAGESLGATLMGWTPADVELVEEDQALPFGRANEDVRGFMMSWTDAHSPTLVAVTVAPDGPRVRMFAVGFEDRLIDPPRDAWDGSWARWLTGGSP